MSLETVSQDIAPPICGCGRSATGFCTGLHRLSPGEWNAMVFDEQFQNEKPTIEQQTASSSG